MLTSRQEQILCKVVDDYLRTGQPVASKSIAADPDFDCGPSTIRNELALLEEQRTRMCRQGASRPMRVIATWWIACWTRVGG